MSPCVACKKPSLCFHRICHSFCTSPLCLQVKIRMGIQPGNLILIKIIRTCLIADIRTISQNAVVSGKGNDSFCPMIGKARICLHKPVDERHHIVVPYCYTSVILHIFTSHFSFLIQHQFTRKSIAVLAMIIAQIILRKDKRCFALRQKNLLRSHNAVLIHLGQIINADHHIPSVIHGLGNLIKLLHRGHHLIVPVCLIISVKRLRRIHDQRMIKNMRHLLGRPGHTGILRLLIPVCRLLHLCAVCKCLITFQKTDGAVIVILNSI